MSRRWELPAEPGPEVTAVRTDRGATYVRTDMPGEGKRLPGPDGISGGWWVRWPAIVGFGLTDVTDEYAERAT